MNLLEVKSTLEKDLDLLMNKRSLCIENNSEKGAIEYTRLIKDTVDLIGRLPQRLNEWETMYSCYSMLSPDYDDFTMGEVDPSKHFINVISIWNQNADGKIIGHEIYERGKKIL